jgi:hypothetical protein
MTAMITTKFLSGWNAQLVALSQDLKLRIFQKNLADFQKTIKRVIGIFDSKDYLYGLFQAMNYAGVSPFIATHDYCIKVLYCNEEGTLEMNVSPIYHLGLEYPDDYKTKHGKQLDEDAVIGLLEKPAAGTLPPGHTAYAYGVDAGILFKDSDISHNKKLTLQLEEIHDGVLVTLSCENQTTSAAIGWSEIGLNNTGFTLREPTTELFEFRPQDEA